MTMRYAGSENGFQADQKTSACATAASEKHNATLKTGAMILMASVLLWAVVVRVLPVVVLVFVLLVLPVVRLLGLRISKAKLKSVNTEF